LEELCGCELQNLVDETGLYIISHRTEHCYESESCLSDKKLKDRATFLAYDADGSDKLSPTVIRKYQNFCCLKNVEPKQTRYVFNSTKLRSLLIIFL
jgi:hypothetical protein